MPARTTALVVPDPQTRVSAAMYAELRTWLLENEYSETRYCISIRAGLRERAHLLSIRPGDASRGRFSPYSPIYPAFCHFVKEIIY